MPNPIERLLNILSYFTAEQQSELISEIERVLMSKSNSTASNGNSEIKREVTAKSNSSVSNGNSEIKREVTHESISTVSNGDVMKSKKRKGKNFMNLVIYMYTFILNI